MTQQVDHRPVKCQSRWWSPRFETVNGSHNGESPLLEPTGIQVATKSMQGTTNGEHRKLIGVRTMSLFGYEVQFVLLECCQRFRILITSYRKDYLMCCPTTKVVKSMYSDALALTVVPCQVFTTVFCSYRACVLKRCCGETF